MVVYSILKKLFKIAVILVACVVIYIGWLAYTGQPVPETLDELIDDVNQRTDGATEKIIDKTSDGLFFVRLWNKTEVIQIIFKFTDNISITKQK